MANDPKTEAPTPADLEHKAPEKRMIDQLDRLPHPAPEQSLGKTLQQSLEELTPDGKALSEMTCGELLDWLLCQEIQTSRGEQGCL